VNTTKEELLLKQRASFSLLTLCLGWMFAFWQTLLSIFEQDSGDLSSFTTYGIILATFYLVVRKREDLKQATLVSSQVGLVFLFLLGLLFVLGEALQIVYLQQASTLLMIPAVVLTSCGPHVARQLVFPLLYLTLLVPLYDADTQERVTVAFSAVGIFLCYFIYLRFQEMVTKPKIPTWEFEDSRWLVPTLIGLGILISAPWLGENVRAFYPVKHRKIVLRAPLGSPGWFGPQQVEGQGWKPNFPNASAVLQAQYYNDDPNERRPIYLYTAYYYSDRRFTELFHERNEIFNAEQWNQEQLKPFRVELYEQEPYTVKELLLTPKDGSESDKVKLHRLVWYWYYVAGVSTIDLALAELLDKVRFISKYAQGAGVIVLSTTYRGELEGEELSEARAYLLSFLNPMHDALEVLKRPEITYEVPNQGGK